MPCYFFSGKQYIRVTRGDIWPGTVDSGYPAAISNWDWGSFGADGIDAALYSGPVDYFFSGDQYIRVTRGNVGPGQIDPGYPAPISNWGWDGFGAEGIDAALWSDTVCYFFSGAQYIRVTRADRGPGKMDAGYPAPISNWGWGKFGANGIDAALNSGPYDYFFSGNEYIRVTRGDTGAGTNGTVDPGYPAPISQWGWKEFGASGIHAALFSGVDFTDPVSAPAGGLGSNQNYVLSANCAPLTEVVITIDITEDVVLTSNGPPMAGASAVKGFSFQLNCFTATGDTDVSQQYIFLYDGSHLSG
jgi:Hemopexin